MKEDVKGVGFGTFIGMQNYNLRHDLIQWLLDIFDPIERSIIVRNRKFELDSRIFGKTLGVADGKEDMINEFAEENTTKNDCKRTLMIILQRKLEKNIEPEQFGQSFTLFLVGTLLMSITSLYVGRSFEFAMKDVKSTSGIRSKNWASLS